MAIEFNTLSSKYLNSYRNGIDFDLFTTNFANRLTGNIGDTFKVIETVQFGVIFNATESLTVNIEDIDGVGGTRFFSQGIDFINEGFFIGATIIIEWTNGSSFSYTLTDGIINITGLGNSSLYISNADFGAMQAIDPTLGVSVFDLDTFVFKQVDKPTSLRYKYDLNPRVEGANNTGLWKSPFDNNDQCYVGSGLSEITTNLLSFNGGQLGSSLGSVTLDYVVTTDGYKHQYTLEHTFIAPYYIDGEISNIQQSLRPQRFTGSNTYAYSRQYEWGNGSGNNAVINLLSNNGNVGYEDENFNGYGDNYVVSNVNLSNSSASGTLEVTETTTVTFQVENLVGSWGESTKVTAVHSKLLDSTQYANQVTPYNDLWLFEKLSNTTGAGAVNGSIINSFSAVVDADPTLLNVSFTITYDAGQQLNISSRDFFWLSFIVATQNIAVPDLVDRITKRIEVNQYSRNNDIELVTNDTYALNFYPEFDATAQTLGRTDITGGDGDLWLAKLNFSMIKSFEPRIETIFFRVLAIDSFNNQFVVWERPFRFIDLNPTGSQFIAENYSAGLNIPSNQDINKVNIVTQDLGGLTQDVLLSFGFQTTWQDWIENLNVPLIFFDSIKANNNRNLKTSNYSDLNGYNIFPVVDIDFSNNVNSDLTTVRFKGSLSEVIDFDDSTRWTGSDGATVIYDSNGNITPTIKTEEDCKIEVTFTHTFGVIPLADIKGVIFLMQTNSLNRPDYIGTDFDYLTPNSKLKGVTTNFIDVETSNNEVKFICQTNNNAINAGLNYSIYSRIRLDQV